MASIADLRMRSEMRHAYLLLIDGVPFGFTDDAALTGSWWGDTFDDRRILDGLTVPGTLKFGLNLQDGLIEEDRATFRLLDIDGTIPRFFGGLAKEFRLLGARLSPRSSPAPVTIDGYGDPLALDEGGYLQTEAIGPSGQRGYYSAVPWADMPGHDHPTVDEPLPVYTPPGTGPLLVEGRRVALYRLIYDPDEGLWPSFADQMEAALLGGWRPMMWWGTLQQAGSVDGRIWSITCAGPGSWIRRSLNSRTTPLWYPVSAPLELEERERYIGIEFRKQLYTGSEEPLIYGIDYSTYEVDPLDVLGSIQTAIAAVAAATGDAGEWDDNTQTSGAGSIDFGADQVIIQCLKTSGRAVQMRLTLNHKVWRALGYDPPKGKGNYDGPQPLFKGPPPILLIEHPDTIQEPLSLYYTGIYSTVPAGELPDTPSGDFAWAGDGKARVFTPLYGGGVSTLSGAGRQVVSITPPANGQVYVESQSIRPPAVLLDDVPVEIDGQACDAARLWVFRGRIQTPDMAEPEETYQVARCHWVEDGSGVMADDGSGLRRGLYIHEWLDPRLFGFNHKPLDPSIGWAGADDSDDGIQASPLAHFGLFFNRPDRVDHTISRLLLGTGTGTWSPGDFDPISDDEISDYSFFIEGANQPLGLDYPMGDVEIYDMSLQLPEAMVDIDSILDVAQDLPGGPLGPLGLGKVAVQGPIQSEDLLSGLLSPRGWCLSLRRGRFGLFAPHISAESKYTEGVDFSITMDDIHGVAGDPGSAIPGVELRPVAPFDTLVLTHSGHPCEGWLEGQEEVRSKARDAGARVRSGAISREVRGPDLIATQWFIGDQVGEGKVDPLWIKSWQTAFRQWWEVQIASWLAQPHRLVTGLRVSRPKGQDILPGSILRLTNPWPANSSGSYGFAGAYARVLSVAHETTSCAAVIDCLVEGVPPNALRWAPILRVVDEATEISDRYDADTRTFSVQSWGGEAPPLAAFIKPTDLDITDAPAKIVGLQFDGVSWTKNFSAFVASVSPPDNSLTLTAAGLTGNFRARMYTILVLAPASDAQQAEWCRVLYAQHTGLPPLGVPKLLK